jgi:hypothetical protein
MIRRVLIGLGTILLSVALLLAFLGHSDQAFVLAALWIVILVAGLVAERVTRKANPPNPPLS